MNIDKTKKKDIIKAIKLSPLKKLNLTQLSKVVGLTRPSTEKLLMKLEILGILVREEELKRDDYYFTWWLLKWMKERKKEIKKEM